VIRRVLAVVKARNLEFLRDRSSLAWNVAMPFLLVIGLALAFAGGERPDYQVGVYGAGVDSRLHPFLGMRHVRFFPVSELDAAIEQVNRHQLDMLLDLDSDPGRYWINDLSGKGYILERLLLASDGPVLGRMAVAGAEIRYVDWVVPGVLGMNMMFSALFGVGYVVVRYRKSGYLKRLHATPLTAFEFLSGQVLSRLVLILGINTMVFAATNLILGFRMEGSYLTLFVVGLLGAICMISLGLVVAARVDSEELAGGMLNLLIWPMMLVSGVWFSLEGGHPLLRQVAQLSPLTHLLEAARAVMLDGAGLARIGHNLLVLLGMSVVFLGIGARAFRWVPK
jgi:ABC-type multidrug transport system permease subunit